MCLPSHSPLLEGREGGTGGYTHNASAAACRWGLLALQSHPTLNLPAQYVSIQMPAYPI